MLEISHSSCLEEKRRKKSPAENNCTGKKGFSQGESLFPVVFPFAGCV